MINLQAGRLRGTVAISAPSQRTAEPQRKNEMEWEEALLYGLGRRDTAAPSGLLSAASRSCPAGRGRGHDQGREGKAARRR